MIKYHLTTFYNNLYEIIDIFVTKGNHCVLLLGFKVELYVKDMFDENGNFRTLEYISTILICKANWICEYHTLFNIFRKLIRKFDFSNAKYVNIRKIHAFLFHNGFYSINKQKCKFFYENLLRKTFQKPIYQSILSKEFHIEDRKLWQNIYRSKVKEIFDKSVAEFN